MKNPNKKAYDLFMATLDFDQQESWFAHGGIEITSQYGNTYRILQASTGNVALMNDNGVVEAYYCLVPGPAKIPKYDMFLAQKMMLEADEDEFLNKALRNR